MSDKTDSWIDESLHALAADDERVAVPPEVEAAVLRAWDMQPAGRAPAPQGPRWHRAWVFVPAAAVVVLAAALLQRDSATIEQLPPPPAEKGIPAPVAASPPAKETNFSAGDVPAVRPSFTNRRQVPAVDEGYVIVPEPLAERATLHVVRVRMARVGLASLGLPIVNPDAEGLVDVEILVGEDGVARSIRRAALVTGELEAGEGR
jgi:hypothetical protein